MNQLMQRKATVDDLPALIDLISDDDLGQHREVKAEQVDPRYIEAFHRIDADPAQYLMVVTNPLKIVSTCHLTLIPSLTFIGSTRLQIEAVHVAKNYRGQKIGEWMIQAAMHFAKENNAAIVQLTSNKVRKRAKRFYERLGFKATHEGMKFYF